MKILIVDDEPEICELFSLELQDEGWSTCVASNGSKAFEIVQENDIDVVISDVRMPGGDGIELLRRIKERNLNSPEVILVTGFADITSDEAIKKGAKAVFAKPIDFAAIIRAIKG